MSSPCRLLVVIGTLTISPGAWAHSGGTDSSGCHTDHSTGDYHCHEGGTTASGDGNVLVVLGALVAVIGISIGVYYAVRTSEAGTAENRARERPRYLQRPDESGVTSPACELSMDCPDEHLCRRGTCKRVCRPGDCSFGEHCVDRLCQKPSDGEERTVPGERARSCRKEEDCDRGWVCSTKYICRQACMRDQDCDISGMSCRNRLCQPPSQSGRIHVGPTPMGLGLSW